MANIFFLLISLWLTRLSPHIWRDEAQHSCNVTETMRVQLRVQKPRVCSVRNGLIENSGVGQSTRHCYRWAVQVWPQRRAEICDVMYNSASAKDDGVPGGAESGFLAILGPHTCSQWGDSSICGQTRLYRFMQQWNKIIKLYRPINQSNWLSWRCKWHFMTSGLCPRVPRLVCGIRFTYWI